MPKIIAVIGPIGYGKYDKATEIVSSHPGYEISCITDQWKQFRRLCLGSHQKHPGHTLVVTNGGSLFFHREKKNIRINITQVYAPESVILFISKFKPVNLDGINHEDFMATDYWKNAYNLMTDEQTPCGKRLRSIINDFNNIIEQTCEQRVKDGSFKLRSLEQGCPLPCKQGCPLPCEQEVQDNEQNEQDNGEQQVQDNGEQDDWVQAPPLRKHRHVNHQNHVFDSLEQSVAELSHYCEKNIKYQLCLALWARNNPNVSLESY